MVNIALVGGELSLERATRTVKTLLGQFTVKNANTRRLWLGKTRVELEQLQQGDFQIRHAGQALRAFITINVLHRSKELNQRHQELTLNENTPSVMLFEMTKSGKIGVKMKER